MKSNLHRRAHTSGGYQANVRGLYPTYKARYKNESNHRIRIADCMLAVDELTDVQSEFDWFQSQVPELQESLYEFDRYVRHSAHGWDEDYYDSLLPYANSVSGYGDEPDPRQHRSIVMTANGYDLAYVSKHEWGVYLPHMYSAIATVTLTGFEWVIRFFRYTNRGHGPSNDVVYEFDYMESSLEAAFALIQTLHRLDCGSEV